MGKSKWMRSFAVACIAVGLLVSSASANLIVNGSFEDPVLDPGVQVSMQAGEVPHWDYIYGADAKVVNAPGAMAPMDGNNLAYMRDSAGACGQIVGATQANTTYTLTLDVGSASTWSGMTPNAYVALTKFDSAGTYLGEYDYMGLTTDPQSSRYIPDLGPGTSTVVTITYTTDAVIPAGEQIGVVLGINPVTPVPFVSGGAVWDNVVLTAVPEPATMSLVALGGLAMLRRKR